MYTSNKTIKWIENLAEQELLIKAGERASIDICTTKEEVLSVETKAFLRELFSQFEYLVALFNSRVNQPALQIALASCEVGEEFSVSRNDMKLSLTSTKPGVVGVQCHKRVVDEEQTRKTVVMFTGHIEAHFETFHDVEWYFLNSRITAEQLARHYLTEFIQSTRAGI